jgi:hypothetical protein
MANLVFVRPSPSAPLVRNPHNPAVRISPEGEMLHDTLRLRRLEAAGDVVITAAPPPAEEQ